MTISREFVLNTHALRNFPSQIQITSITPPQVGWPIIFHCDICRRTEILLCLWLVKPKDGDYLLMRKTCVDPEFWAQHEFDMHPIDWTNARPDPRL